MLLFRYSLINVILSVLLINCNAQETYNTKNVINVGTHNLHMLKKGIGPPTIVLDVGLGSSYKAWLPLFDIILQKCQVFFYDRAGYGKSEKGPFPRTSERAADELKELLDKTETYGPYILVGHSLGALNLQVFAHKYSSNISGILLLDPPPLDWILGNSFPELITMAEEQTEAFEKMAESLVNSNDVENLKKIDFYQTIASEHHELFSYASNEVAGINSFRNIPMIVIASGKPNPAFGKDAVQFQKYWNNQCKRLAEKSSRGKYVLASESSHQIHLDDQDIILGTLDELIALYQEE